ncbi:hypothetical protein BKA70DRAFT_1436251 [Coprinopsis sp. MPI-PUGE-AT-0042]|nr:hypothetical protein BKA70DRAFT_1436251 [Coprinopsis sp. MPI-PUGE-AT-0042]
MVGEYQRPLATDAAYWKLKIVESSIRSNFLYFQRRKTVPETLVREVRGEAIQDRRSSCVMPTSVLVPRGSATTGRVFNCLKPRPIPVSAFHQYHPIPQWEAKSVDSCQGGGSSKAPHTSQEASSQIPPLGPSQPSTSSHPDPDTSSGSGCVFINAIPDLSIVLFVKAKKPTAEPVSEYACCGVPSNPSLTTCRHVWWRSCPDESIAVFKLTLVDRFDATRFCLNSIEYWVGIRAGTASPTSTALGEEGDGQSTRGGQGRAGTPSNDSSVDAYQNAATRRICWGSVGGSVIALAHIGCTEESLGWLQEGWSFALSCCSLVGNEAKGTWETEQAVD